MISYFLRRLLLLPLTLFCIVLVNFVIINLAPGDPITITDIAAQGGLRQADRSFVFGSDYRYLQFREFFGLTLPILFNTWPFTSETEIRQLLEQLVSHKDFPGDSEEMSLKKYDELRTSFGDRARFIMPQLLAIMQNPKVTPESRRMAVRFFVRGGTRQAYLGPDLPEEQRAFNRKISVDNSLLASLLILPTDTLEQINKKKSQLEAWYLENESFYNFNPSFTDKVFILLFETRFFKYMSRVLRLDFGTMRNDANKTVISEVTKRLKYSLTLSVLPMILTFFLCQIFGFLMAYKRNQWSDIVLNLFFLVLYAIPIFVVAPFLIEKVALHHNFFFTDIPIPISGFTSPEAVYSQLTSWQRLGDVLQHILLPLIAILYGGLAAYSRLSRTAVLEVMHHDYVRTARAKGLSSFQILRKHIGRNAAITIVTPIAGSLGIILGGSLIVEILFEIDGFGKFFYDAVINRDYNVIMFSALAGSFLTLIGYLIGDLAYTLLDPRVTLE